MGPKKEEEKQPLLDSTGQPQVHVTEEDVAGKGIESDNEAIDADDEPADEVDPSDHASR